MTDLQITVWIKFVTSVTAAEDCGILDLVTKSFYECSEESLQSLSGPALQAKLSRDTPNVLQRRLYRKCNRKRKFSYTLFRQAKAEETAFAFF